MPVKKRNTYFFDGNENKFATAFVSEDGLDFLVAARNDDKGAYFKFSKDEIFHDEAIPIWEAAAMLAMSYLERD